MFNLKLPQNFNSPYQARSIIDFWRRWHMTLGGWVKDYLYIPMGGNRNGEWKKMRNLFVSMLIIGLWHGAGWTFVFWGGLHGFFLMVNHQWRRLGISLPKFINWGLTFLCVVICWVFFRAENFHDALAVLLAMTDVGNIALPAGGIWEKHLGFMRDLGVTFITWTGSFSKQATLLSLLMIILMLIPNPIKIISHFKPNIIWLSISLAIMLYTLCKFSQISDFLYFQF